MSVLAFAGDGPLAFPRFPDFVDRRAGEGSLVVAFAGKPCMAFPRPPEFEGRGKGA